MADTTRRRFMLGAAAFAAVPGLARAQEPGPIALRISNGKRQRFETAANGVLSDFGGKALSIAISRRGEVRYVDAFGSDGGQPVTPAHKFRFASLTKPITAAAVLSLVDDGTVTRDDRVFGPDGWLEKRFPTTALPEAERLAKVTVDHLLTHNTGAWPNLGQDPTMRYPELTQDELIARTLAEYDMPVEPGDAHQYSNFGYILLGRVIEAASGQSYADFVDERVCRPAGIGGHLLQIPHGGSPNTNEVTYPLGSAYNNTHGLGDSAFGWIGTASDLLAILAVIDGYKSVPDILDRKTVNVMTTPTKLDPWYARGWSINTKYNNWFHTGWLAGVITAAVRYNSEVNGVAFITANVNDSDPVSSALFELINEIGTSL